MRNLLLLILIILIFGCTTPPEETVKEEKYTFEKGLAELKAIEDKYSTPYPGLPDNQTEMWNMFAEMNILKNRVENMVQTNEIRALRYYLFFRWKSYESNMQLRAASAYPLRQAAEDMFICPSSAAYFARMNSLNKTLQYGNESLHYLNTLYKYYPEFYAKTSLLSSYPKLFEANYAQLAEQQEKRERGCFKAMHPKLKCPFHKIDISEDREIVNCDKLRFPWKQDKEGYFLVKIENKDICCGFVNNSHKMILELRGNDPDKIIKEIAKRKLVDLEHMGYIAQELQIAKGCLDTGKKYIQR